MGNEVIVTRFIGMRDYLVDRGLASFSTPVLKHVPMDDIDAIKGKHVIGVVPLWLAAMADKVTVVPLHFNESVPFRSSMGYNDIKKVAGAPVTYKVSTITPEDKPDVMVIRHLGMRDYLIMNGMASFDTPFIRHIVDTEEVVDKHVIGVLPLWLASKASCVTTVILEIPYELRGEDLDYEQVEKLSGGVKTYKVACINS